MTAIISWDIASLERETSDDFVFTAHWTVNAVEEEDGEQFSASAYGSIGLERPENLIPYKDLTKELVVGWVQEKMGEEQVEAMEEFLLAQITEQKQPAKAQGVPWA
jgi:hypothetical protein